MGYEGWQNTSMARVPLTLPAAYGYVLLSAFISVIAIAFLAESVSGARKRHKVDYPLLYADQHAVRGAACDDKRVSCGCADRCLAARRRRAAF
jgi:hypothetical protein